MSKSSLPRELLSASFDGEVSAEEHAAVSRAVRKSPTAQQMLDDYAQLSESMQTLKQGVPSPDLRNAVLAEIQSPVQQPRPSESAWLKRPWVKVAGGALAAMAAGLLLLLWPAGRAAVDRDELAMKATHDAAVPPHLDLAGNESSSALDVVDDRLRLPGPSPSTEELAERETPAEPSDPRIALDADERDLVREALIPEEWLTQQFAAAHRIPKPGDVMDYILREADETVVIPVTVVDVQLTAGQIRVLLQKHDIQPLSHDEEGEPHDAAPITDSSMAILVESNWERVSEVMEDLDTQGFGVATTVESSPAAKLAMMTQNQVTLSGEGPEFARRLRGDAATRARKSLPGGVAHGDEPVESHERVEEAPLRRFHAQWAAPVSDEFVRKLEQKQQAVFADEADTAVVAESIEKQRQPAEQASAAEGSAAAAVVDRRKPWQVYATRAPARVLILIKKSGNGR